MARFVSFVKCPWGIQTRTVYDPQTGTVLQVATYWYVYPGPPRSRGPGAGQHKNIAKHFMWHQVTLWYVHYSRPNILKVNIDQW